MDDFEGEFEPIQRVSEEEAKNDRLVQQIRLLRKLREEEKGKIRGKESQQDTEQSLNISDSEIKEIEKEVVEVAEDSNGTKRSLGPFYINLKKIKLQATNQDVPKPMVDGEELKASEPLESTESPETQDSGDSPPKRQPNLQRAFNFFQKLHETSKSSNIVPKVTPTETPKKSESEAELKDSQDDIFDPKNYPGYENLFAKYADFEPKKSDLLLIKKIVTSQLIGKSENFPNILQSSLREKYDEIYRMFEHTIRDNEGHSALLIGPRSSGKTAIIQRALRELEKKYTNEFIVVKLNAFHQTDENTALREIARQLDKNLRNVRGNTNHNEDVEYGNFEQRSLSDTFNNILAILDRNTKGNESSTSQEPSKGEQSGDRTVSIIIVVEEFEKFTLSSKQTLLYNLFDLSQNSSTPVCVIGSTSKVTTRELLEKRVRSRFSQRIISIHKPRSVDEFWSNAKLGLLLSDKSIQRLDNHQHGELWNEYIEESFKQTSSSTSGSSLRKLVLTTYYTTKNYKEFNNSVLPAIANLISKSHPFPLQEDFAKYLSCQSINGVQSIVKSLSELELLIIIAAARWIEKSSLQIINFSLAYKEYEEMIKQYNISATAVQSTSSNTSNQILTNFKINQRVWSPNILKNSWENLYKLDLLLEPIIEKATQGYNSGVIEDSHMVHLDVSLSELGELVDDSHFAKKLTTL